LTFAANKKALRLVSTKGFRFKTYVISGHTLTPPRNQHGIVIQQQHEHAFEAIPLMFAKGVFVSITLII